MAAGQFRRPLALAQPQHQQGGKAEPRHDHQIGEIQRLGGDGDFAAGNIEVETGVVHGESRACEEERTVPGQYPGPRPPDGAIHRSAA